ncbi:MAG: hypothetical protein R2854_15060 [Caldilineaceae bacterium]
MTETLRTLPAAVEFMIDTPSSVCTWMWIRPRRRIKAAHAYQIWLLNEVRRLRDEDPARTWAHSTGSLPAFNARWETEHTGGRGLAIFAGDDMWHMVQLDVAPDNLLTWRRPRCPIRWR